MRIIITADKIYNSLEAIKSHTANVLRRKGFGSFSSIHEIGGVITEEYDEIKDAIHKNDKKQLRSELLDLATSCHFAIACLDSDSL